MTTNLAAYSNTCSLAHRCVGQRSGTRGQGPLHQGTGSYQAEIRVLARLHFTWSSVSAFSLIQVFGRIHFLAFVRLRSLFPCWLSAMGHPHLLKAACVSCHRAPFIFQASKREPSPTENLSHTLNLLCQKNTVPFKDSSDQVWPTKDNRLIWKINHICKFTSQKHLDECLNKPKKVGIHQGQGSWSLFRILATTVGSKGDTSQTSILPQVLARELFIIFLAL